jgi:hypothetical protein
MSMTCISCGMPMEQDADHAMGDRSKTYCVYCAAPDGSMKSYEDALAGMTAFITRTQGIDEKMARTMAAGAMANQAAWKGRH